MELISVCKGYNRVPTPKKFGGHAVCSKLSFTKRRFGSGVFPRWWESVGTSSAALLWAMEPEPGDSEKDTDECYRSSNIAR